MGEGGKEIKGLSFAENFLLSGAAAVIAKTAAAPIERVKLLVQNQDEMIKQGRLDKPYTGVIDCTVRTFRQEVSGGAAGALSLVFVYSLDYARTRLANDNKSAKKGGTREFNGLVDVYAGFYFGLYDTLKPIFLGPDAGVAISFCLGYGVTVTSGLISYPIDTIRRRQAVKYKSSIHCASEILKNEGPMSLMKGAGANILRGVAGAGVLAGFDKFKELYADFRLPKKPSP
ncbi:unnamed protein product [Schistosoma mattheei]|uniref:ADP/ATP translocase n=1 Tax=Schistosoma mattheei TaxID=31246 RepID=A0A183PNP0_9TREM|nr:unnamed protein product [Schistosoma mattheei]